MAYGLLCFPVPRNQASPTTPEARGPPSLALWNGMGSSGYHRPPSITFPSVTICVISLFLLISVEGFSLRSDECQVGICTSEYKSTKQDLNISESGTPDIQAICTALRTYRHCISRIEGCTGNIMYYSLRNSVLRQMEDFNCNKSGVIVKPPKKIPRVPVPPKCKFQGKKVYRHCGLFGDPHLRTFNGLFQTCKVKGAWPLISNDYLIVQVTNDPVEGNSDATATSKLTVIVKGNQMCTSKDFQTYQAQTNNLPGSFEDGHVSYGPYHSLEVVEVLPDKHVEIHIRYIATVVIIHQIGRYLTFSIKMPEELINSSRSNGDLQLCARGCPSSELINYQQYLADKKLPPPQPTSLKRDEAEEICRKAKLVDFYYDSCVFDLMSTGDQNFTVSALVSLQDLLKLQPSASQTISNRSSLETYDQQYGNGDNNSQVSSWRTSFEFKVQLVLILLLTCLSRTTSLIPS